MPSWSLWPEAVWGADLHKRPALSPGLCLVRRAFVQRSCSLADCQLRTSKSAAANHIQAACALGRDRSEQRATCAVGHAELVIFGRSMRHAQRRVGQTGSAAGRAHEVQTWSEAAGWPGRAGGVRRAGRLAGGRRGAPGCAPLGSGPGFRGGSGGPGKASAHGSLAGAKPVRGAQECEAATPSAIN